jgi:O-antigen/teichoic acid export membrane protein
MYFCLNKFNVIFLQGFVDKQQLALFTFALQLSTIIAVIAGSAGKAIQPVLYKLSELDVIATSKRLAQNYKFVMSIILLVFILFSKSIILLFAPPQFLESESLLKILLISAFLYNLRSVESSLFFYFHKTKWTLYITSISAFVVVALSVFLVPKYGVTASAYSILVGSIVAFFCNIIFYKLLVRNNVNRESEVH